MGTSSKQTPVLWVMLIAILLFPVGYTVYKKKVAKAELDSLWVFNSYNTPILSPEISDDGDYVKSLKINARTTEDGSLKVNEEFEVVVRTEVAANAHMVRIFPTSLTRIPYVVQKKGEPIRLKVTPQNITVFTLDEKGSFVKSKNAFSFIDKKPPHGILYQIGESPLGVGEHRLTLTYEIKDFISSVLKQGHLFFEIGPRFGVPTKSVSLSLEINTLELLPKSIEPNDYPIVGVAHFKNHKTKKPASFSTLIGNSRAIFSLEQTKEKSWVMKASVPKGVATTSRIVLDYDLRGRSDA